MAHSTKTTNIVGDTMTRSTQKRKEVLSSCLLIVICLLFCSSATFAGGAESIVSRHAFEIGLGVSYYDYDEDSVDVEMAGPMYDVVGSYTYHHKIMMNASLEYSRGDLEYDGSIKPPWASEPPEPFEADTQDWKVECRLLVGWDFLFRQKHVVTPFLGIGYGYWSSNLREFIANYPEVDREHWYSPIGVRTHSPLADNWTWGMSLEYDLFWYGKVKADYALWPTVELDQERGHGVGLSLRLRRQFANDCAISVEPYIRYWRIDESDRAYVALPRPEPGDIFLSGAVEPENERTSYGLRIIYEF